MHWSERRKYMHEHINNGYISYKLITYKWEMTKLTFDLWVGNATPFSTAIAHTRTAHHVTQNIMASVPLISQTIHHTLASGTHLLMSWWKPHRHYSQTFTFKFTSTVSSQNLRWISQWDKNISLLVLEALDDFYQKQPSNSFKEQH